MTDKLGMKKKLDNTGLLFMVLGTVTICICFLVITIISGFNVPFFGIMIAPAIVFTYITRKNRLFGGLLATVISALMLVPLGIWLTTPEATPPNYILFAVIICFFLGGVCTLTSLSIRSPAIR